jgi:hypothetical protein
MSQCSPSDQASLISRLRCKYRVFDAAVLDLVLSIVPMGLLAQRRGLPFYRGAAASIPLGIATHALLSIDTPWTLKFFDMDRHFAFKLFVVLATYVAVEGNPLTAVRV